MPFNVDFISRIRYAENLTSLGNAGLRLIQIGTSQDQINDECQKVRSRLLLNEESSSILIPLISIPGFDRRVAEGGGGIPKETFDFSPTLSWGKPGQSGRGSQARL